MSPLTGRTPASTFSLIRRVHGNGLRSRERPPESELPEPRQTVRPPRTSEDGQDRGVSDSGSEMGAAVRCQMRSEGVRLRQLGHLSLSDVQKRP